MLVSFPGLSKTRSLFFCKLFEASFVIDVPRTFVFPPSIFMVDLDKCVEAIFFKRDFTLSSSSSTRNC